MDCHELFENDFVDEFVSIKQVPEGEYFLARNYSHVYQVVSKNIDYCNIICLYSNAFNDKHYFLDSIDFEVRLEKK